MKHRKHNWLFALCALTLVTVATAGAFSLPGLGKYEKVKATNGAVTIPVNDLSDGKAHFFQFSDGGKEIKFFVVKGSDGNLHSAFDACDACYREKKGYVQQGDMMVCKNCNMKFQTSRVGHGSGGGCNPSPLAHANDGKNVRFNVTDLVAGIRFF